jgi:hypothetical protein
MNALNEMNAAWKALYQKERLRMITKYSEKVRNLLKDAKVTYASKRRSEYGEELFGDWEIELEYGEELLFFSYADGYLDQHQYFFERESEEIREFRAFLEEFDILDWVEKMEKEEREEKVQHAKEKQVGLRIEKVEEVGDELIYTLENGDKIVRKIFE